MERDGRDNWVGGGMVNGGQAVGDPAELPERAVVCAAADGEAWAEAELRRRFAAGVPAGVQRRLDAERALRERVRAAMSGEAPAGLAEEVRAALRGEGAVVGGEGVGGDGGGDRASTGGVGVLARIGGVLAVAAVLALSATVLVQAYRSFGAAGGGLPNESTVRQISSYVSERHEACEGFGASFERRFERFASAEAAGRFVGESIGECPRWFEDRVGRMERAGFELAGVASCPVPGIAGETVHLVFRGRGIDETVAPVSVFLKRLPEDAEMGEGSCFTCARSQEAGKPFLFWREGRFALFVRSTGREPADAARSAFGAPDLLRAI